MSMTLEELRRDTLGVVAAWLPCRGSDDRAMVPLTHPEYAMAAFYYSCQSVEDLEKSDKIVNQSVKSTTATAYWFLAIEALINANLKIACGLTNASFDKYSAGDLGNRIRGLAEITKIDLKDYYKAGLFARLQDFMTFRNELFHDRFFDTERAYKHTSFSPLAHLLNQVDVIQASVIALESFIAFGRLYPGVELMPNIKVEKDDSFGWMPYDKLHDELTVPYFERALQKHKLSSSVERSPVIHCLPETKIAPKGSVRICIKAVQEEKFHFKPNEEKSSIGVELFAKIREQIKVAKDTFPLPNYSRG